MKHGATPIISRSDDFIHIISFLKYNMCTADTNLDRQITYNIGIEAVDYDTWPFLKDNRTSWLF